MRKKDLQTLLLPLIILTFYSTINAQKTIENRPLKILYNVESSINIHILTDGWGIGYDIGKIETYYRTKFTHIEFGGLHHFKEFTNSNKNRASGIGGSYKYGKQNSLYFIRAGKGKIRYLSDKSNKRGITIGYMLEGGVTMGFLKPYFLKFERNKDGLKSVVEEKYTTDNASDFLNSPGIEGKSLFWKGIGETKIIPGIHGKIASVFSLRASSDLVTALEIGVIGDVFIRNVPLMILQKNRPYFFNLYVTLHFGKRK